MISFNWITTLEYLHWYYTGEETVITKDVNVHNPSIIQWVTFQNREDDWLEQKVKEGRVPLLFLLYWGTSRASFPKDVFPFTIINTTFITNSLCDQRKGNIFRCNSLSLTTRRDKTQSWHTASIGVSQEELTTAYFLVFIFVYRDLSQWSILYFTLERKNEWMPFRHI